jgi:hypothetical protein
VVGRLVALCLVALAAGCAGGADEQLSLPPGQSFAATGTITPRTSAFGDTLTARLRILVDRDELDPAKIRVLARFPPYRDRTTIERIDSGNITALVYTIELQCLTISCVAPEREFVAQFGSARIVSDVGPVQEVQWPDVTVVTRARAERFAPENTGEEPDQWPPRWRAAVAVADPSYRAAAGLLIWLLGGAGALLVGASAAAAFVLLRRGRLIRELEVAPLDRALAQLRNARTDQERRAALEALALALDTELDPELAEPARALAWSEPGPSESAAEELARVAKEAAR